MKIKDLIIDRLETTIGKFCNEVGISRTTYDYIMKEQHELRLDTIKKICRYFNVDFHDYI